MEYQHYITNYNIIRINKSCFKMVLDDIEQSLGYILCAMHVLLYIYIIICFK